MECNRTTLGHSVPRRGPQMVEHRSSEEKRDRRDSHVREKKKGNVYYCPMGRQFLEQTRKSKSQFTAEANVSCFGIGPMTGWPSSIGRRTTEKGVAL